MIIVATNILFCVADNIICAADIVMFVIVFVIINL